MFLWFDIFRWVGRGVSVNKVLPVSIAPLETLEKAHSKEVCCGEWAVGRSRKVLHHYVVTVQHLPAAPRAPQHITMLRRHWVWPAHVLHTARTCWWDVSAHWVGCSNCSHLKTLALKKAQSADAAGRWLPLPWGRTEVYPQDIITDQWAAHMVPHQTRYAEDRWRCALKSNAKIPNECLCTCLGSHCLQLLQQTYETNQPV